MLGDNLKELRKQKGMSQEELATRINVVRQTVSKWEKNLSVPDAEMLQKIASELDVSVETLLGAPIGKEPDRNEIAEQLARINEQLASQNKRRGKIFKTILIVIAVIIAVKIAITTLGVVSYSTITSSGTTVETVETEDEMAVESPDGTVSEVETAG